jgi:hypothetical protein
MIGPDEDKIEDFFNKTSIIPVDLMYSLSLDSDITVSSQLLLQELGDRLYHVIGHWMACEAISGFLPVWQPMPSSGMPARQQQQSGGGWWWGGVGGRPSQ